MSPLIVIIDSLLMAAFVLGPLKGFVLHGMMSQGPDNSQMLQGDNY